MSDDTLANVKRERREKFCKPWEDAARAMKKLGEALAPSTQENPQPRERKD